jgi:hypothetical protein
VLTDNQVSLLLNAKDKVLHSALLLVYSQACALWTDGGGGHS